MAYGELKQKVLDYFGDTTRSPFETKSDLESLAEECLMLASSINASDDFGDSDPK